LELFIWIPDQVGNDKQVMIDSSFCVNLSFLFVIVGLDPTIQKISDNHIHWDLLSPFGSQSLSSPIIVSILKTNPLNDKLGRCHCEREHGNLTSQCRTESVFRGRTYQGGVGSLSSLFGHLIPFRNKM
jgi:hypothetical protein